MLHLSARQSLRSTGDGSTVQQHQYRSLQPKPAAEKASQVQRAFLQ
jgi:hypothetical protein